MADTDREEYVTLARAGCAFYVVAAARDLMADPQNDTCWLRLEEAIADLDALDTANHRERSVSERLGQ